MLNSLEEKYYKAKENIWLQYFTVFCRIMLALGFLPSGFVKVMGERFTALSSNHPLGNYLEALHHTGYYYTFIGVMQLTIAVLLLIPRTALFGAIMYFPFILNICILTYATRFEGTRITTLMLLANLYLLCWDYNRLKSILLFNPSTENGRTLKNEVRSKKFPFLFFAGVIVTVGLVIVINQFLYDIRPGNSVIECTNGCPGNDNPKACADFCNCIYEQGKPLDSCLAEYNRQKILQK